MCWLPSSDSKPAVETVKKLSGGWLGNVRFTCASNSDGKAAAPRCAVKITVSPFKLNFVLSGQAHWQAAQELEARPVTGPAGDSDSGINYSATARGSSEISIITLSPLVGCSAIRITMIIMTRIFRVTCSDSRSLLSLRLVSLFFSPPALWRGRGFQSPAAFIVNPFVFVVDSDRPRPHRPGPGPAPGAGRLTVAVAAAAWRRQSASG